MEKPYKQEDFERYLEGGMKTVEKNRNSAKVYWFFANRIYQEQQFSKNAPEENLEKLNELEAKLNLPRTKPKR